MHFPRIQLTCIAAAYVSGGVYIIGACPAIAWVLNFNWAYQAIEQKADQGVPETARLFEVKNSSRRNGCVVYHITCTLLHSQPKL